MIVNLHILLMGIWGCIIMPLPLHFFLAQTSYVRWYPESLLLLLGAKLWHGAWCVVTVVEALNPHEMALKSIPNIYTYTGWLATFISCGWGYSCVTMLGVQRCHGHGAVVEALNPHGMVSLQTYTRWLTAFICCGWGYGCVIMPLAISTTLVCPDLRIYFVQELFRKVFLELDIFLLEFLSFWNVM